MRTTILSASFALSFVVALTGCGLVKVQGGPEASTPEATPASAEATPSEGGTTAPPANAVAEKKASKGESDSESSFMGELQTLGAIERNGEVFVSTAIEGFSADDLKKIIKSRHDAAGEQPSDAILARADAALAEQKKAAEAASKKYKMPAAAASDAAAEKAIAADFVANHPGAEVKKVVMTSDWKTNMNGLVVRNRYKDAVVVMAVKGADFCLRVPANAAQDAKGTSFDTAFKHDVFDKGTAVACN